MAGGRRRRRALWPIASIAIGLGGITDLEQSRNALYLLDTERGAIWELRYTQSNNQAPSATLAVDRTAGKPPLAVTAPSR